MSQKLMKGNEAVVLGALLGGSTHYFGYPITPASEIAHAAALWYPKCERIFLQAECETASVNMLYGAAAAGARAMTGTSGPGLSLMAEGISYIAAAELPCVIVDVQRAGPGLGNIWPEQTDYYCTVKGGGHGNYQPLVLAPNSAQELCDFTYDAFALADKYRAPVIILSDAYIGQMMEPVQPPDTVSQPPRKAWALNADAASRGNLITSIYMEPELQQTHNQMLCRKAARMAAEDVRWEEVQTEDADILCVAYGISSRLCQTANERLRAKGVRIGLLRPQTLFPFPSARLRELADTVRTIMVVELSEGQMIDDVRLAVGDRVPVTLCNWMGGCVPTTEELIARIEGHIHHG